MTVKKSPAVSSLAQLLFDDCRDALFMFDPSGKLVVQNRAAESLGISVNNLGDVLERLKQAGMTDFTTRPVSEAGEHAHGTLLRVGVIPEYEQLRASQSEFIEIVSHDLRSPLTALRGYAEMLREEIAGPLNSQQRTYLERILNGLYQLSDMVHNIQDAGRFDPDTGLYVMEFAPVDLNALARQAAERVILPLDKRQITLEQVHDEALPVIIADEVVLTSALRNLLDNAIKYSPDGSKILVRTERTAAGVSVSIVDDGPGISADDQQRLFQKHSRIVNEHTRRVRGSGLGLFIVRAVAQRHGGDVHVESTPGKGSTFTISLPLDARSR
jgi:signal transduction histidine kinase